AIGFALSFALTGCHTHPQNVTTIHGRRIPGGEMGGLPAIPPPETTVGIPLNTNADLHANWIADPDRFKEQTVHFAYDSSVVRKEDRAKVAVVADYLKGNPQTAVRAEGNCDERGTEEYNRSLGERRALAAREELIRLGVAADRVDTISYGEDKPVDT